MWGWFRGLKLWQRYWIAGWALSIVWIVLLVIDARALGGRVTGSIPLPIGVVAISAFFVGGWLLQWRARSHFTDEHPEFREQLRMWRANAFPSSIGEALFVLGVRRWFRTFFYGRSHADPPKAVTPLPSRRQGVQVASVPEETAVRVPADAPIGILTRFRQLKQWQRDYITQWIVWFLVVGLLLAGVYVYRGDDSDRFPFLLLGPFFLLIGFGIAIAGRARSGFLNENPHLRGVMREKWFGVEAMGLTEMLIRRALGQFQKPK
jgi:hypothetical protein